MEKTAIKIFNDERLMKVKINIILVKIPIKT
jgi:hypothetical protein